MTDKELARRRIIAQSLVRSEYTSPVDIVTAFGAMQGQDISVLSSVALRLRNPDIEPVLDAVRAHKIVRAYPMRGTVFLAAAEDMQWLTDLCSPAIKARSKAKLHSHYGISEKLYAQLRERMSELGQQGITRAQFKGILMELLGEKPSSGAVYRTLFQLLIEHDVVYSGWNGKEQLIFNAADILGPGLDIRFNGDRIAAIVHLMERYFSSRGPAALQDFSWWSKLPKKEIAKAAGQLSDSIVQLADGSYMSADILDKISSDQNLLKAAEQVLLLPAFDELVLGYADRLYLMDEAVHSTVVPGNMGVFRKPVVIGAKVRGAWNQKRVRGSWELELPQTTQIPVWSLPGVKKKFKEFPRFN